MDQSGTLFLYLAVILGLASIFGFITKLLKLPLVVAYLLVGLLLSVSQLFDGGISQTLHIFPELGIALVLFLVGMELDIDEMKYLGKPILVTTVIYTILATLVGFIIASAFGVPLMEAWLLGIGLSFSSTIVVVKLLIEKKDLTSLYGKLALGILLVEDVIAVILLMVMTVGNSFLHVGLQNTMPFIALILKGVGLWLITILASRYILKRVFEKIAQLTELLFLTALAWCFIFIALSVALGFSVVIGAFLAGISLANSPFHFEIQGKVRPLRDFFVALFFVYLGTQIVFEDVVRLLPVIVLFTVFALVGKPLLFMSILGTFGFKKHTLFQTSVSQTQISEFSLLVMVVGLNLGLVSQGSLTTMAVTGVATIIISSIVITYSRNLYNYLGKFVGMFEHISLIHRFDVQKNTQVQDEHVIVIGAHRLGGAIVTFFKNKHVQVLVVDFNPRVVQSLIKKGVNALYGDIGDPEVLDFLNLEKARLIVSTAQDNDDTHVLLGELKRKKVSAPVIVRAATIHDARVLYKNGADYVILPEIVAADFVRHLLRVHWPRTDYFKDRAQTELNKLDRHTLAVE